MFTLNKLDSHGNEIYAFLKKENTVGILSDKFRMRSVPYITLIIFLIFFLCLWVLYMICAFLHRRYMLADEEEEQNRHELQNVTQTGPNYGEPPHDMLEPRGPYIYRSSFRKSCRRYSV